MGRGFLLYLGYLGVAIRRVPVMRKGPANDTGKLGMKSIPGSVVDEEGRNSKVVILRSEGTSSEKPPLAPTFGGTFLRGRSM